MPQRRHSLRCCALAVVLFISVLLCERASAARPGISDDPDALLTTDELASAARPGISDDPDALLTTDELASAARPGISKDPDALPTTEELAKLRRVKRNSKYRGTVTQLAALLRAQPDLVR